MGNLASFLQSAFVNSAPPGWLGKREVALAPRELTDLLGYAPRADVLLARSDGSQRLWIEFEISRADPVANHAKFASIHLFQPQLATDAFVAMVSPHVTRGRRNLATATVLLLRHIGMNAYQTVLLPHLSPSEVNSLNHQTPDVLATSQLNVDAEIERVLGLVEPVLVGPNTAIHFAGDILEVLINLRQWNTDIQTAESRNSWGRRAATYFVCDPQSRLFAPAKFCAYVPLPRAKALSRAVEAASGWSGMSVKLYTTLDQADPGSTVTELGATWLTG